MLHGFLEQLARMRQRGLDGVAETFAELEGTCAHGQEQGIAGKREIKLLTEGEQLRGVEVMSS